jgi:hypothetical protein
MSTISENLTRKFTDVVDLSEWSVMTDTGWEKLSDIKQTVPYDVWQLELSNNMTLQCADDHIVFLTDYTEIFVKDLKTGDNILTQTGPASVTAVYKTNLTENMYDVGVDSIHHRYYSNGILSHNTTTAAGYLLWYAMFVPDCTVLIAAHKYTGAQEIMSRIRFAYESCPDHIRSGVTSYNKHSIEFENGSRIIAQTTTETTGRGLSVSLLYCLDGDTSMVRIRNKQTLVEEDISLKDLFIRLSSPDNILTDDLTIVNYRSPEGHAASCFTDT